MDYPRHLFDRSTPAVIIKSSGYDTHHSGLGIMRSLGRVGVPVYTVTANVSTDGPNRTAAERSRHLSGLLTWPQTLTAEAFVEQMRGVAERFGRPFVPIATDDVSAILLAENVDALADSVLAPRPDPGVPARLGSKQGLAGACEELGIPTARNWIPASVAELAELANAVSYPLVVKAAQPGIRLDAAASSTTIVATAEELLSRFGSDRLVGVLMLQEYIPPSGAQDWFVHAYCDRDGESAVQIVGRKLRSWPPRAGATAYAQTVANPELAALAASVCRATGYRGICDMDWRFDPAANNYKLLDFNPRVGAQHRIGRTTAGIGVVEALHLDMTGREIPRGGQIVGRRLLVENTYLLGVPGYRRLGAHADASRGTKGELELGWWAWDDPRPAVSMVKEITIRASASLGRHLPRAANRT